MLVGFCATDDEKEPPPGKGCIYPAHSPKPHHHKNRVYTPRPHVSPPNNPALGPPSPRPENQHRRHRRAYPPAAHAQCHRPTPPPATPHPLKAYNSQTRRRGSPAARVASADWWRRSAPHGRLPVIGGGGGGRQVASPFKLWRVGWAGYSAVGGFSW